MINTHGTEHIIPSFSVDATWDDEEHKFDDIVENRMKCYNKLTRPGK